MNQPENHCLGFECEVARNCRLHVRKTRPHDALFMSPAKGKHCPYFTPLHEREDHDSND